VLWLPAVIVAPVFWFVIPAARLVAETPGALVRAIRSKRRWVDARCSWPAELTITWETTEPQAPRVADVIAVRLADGYENLTPDGARFVSMTRPPGADDR